MVVVARGVEDEGWAGKGGGFGFLEILVLQFYASLPPTSGLVPSIEPV